MNRRLFVLRPEPALAATVAAARNMGFEVVAAPIAEVAPVAWQPPADDAFDALLLGSANAVRHAGPAFARWRGRTAYVVGAATADAARAAGFTVGLIGQGGLQSVLDALGGSGQRLLRLSGEAHVPVAAPAGIAILTRVVYRLDYRPLSPPLIAGLEQGGIALLHSAEAAAHFAAECRRLAIPRDRLALATIGPRVALAAGSGWTRVASAPAPTDAALLALAHEMCQ